MLHLYASYIQKRVPVLTKSIAQDLVASWATVGVTVNSGGRVG